MQSIRQTIGRATGFISRIGRFARTLVGVVAIAAVANAEERPSIVVSAGAEQTYRLAVQEFADASPAPPGTDRTDLTNRTSTQRYRAALVGALEFSGVFQSLDFEAFLGPTQTQLSKTGRLSDEDVLADCADWSQIGADGLIEGQLTLTSTAFTAEFRVWDATRCTRLLAKRYRQGVDADPLTIAKRMADDIARAFTGVRGVAATEIAFISSRDGNGEVYVMDADGGSARPATDNGSVNLLPSWSPTGDAIVYTSWRHLNTPFLYLLSRGGRRKTGRVLDALGTDMHQYRGVFDPSGERLAVVIANGKVPSEIYTVRPDGKRLRRLTKNRTIDVSPSWSPDGSQIAFVSNRTGTPQIYIMNANGSGVRRLTFDGRYNTAPAWSPDGAWIAYEVRVGSQFDIWLIDPNANATATSPGGLGVANIPLVTHPTSDEHPSWAPNAQKLAFSSMRRGRSDIYVIDINGDNLRRLTRNAGDNKSPAWGRFPR